MLLGIGMLLTLGLGIAAAQQKAGQQRETVAKPISAKEQRKRLEKLKKELETPYRKWLDEDVAYIITDEERAAFKRLETDEEREQFIEQFWLRRDPTPDTVENEYKEEHYRRIAYANERYASGIPGWKTDRGRIYITFGPPDENRVAPLRRQLRSARTKKAAAPRPPIRSRTGDTVTSRASEATSRSSSWIRR